MLFERKLYSKLLDWKEHHGGEYSLLIEGARRVGKSTLVEAFVKREYESYILIDFSSVKKDVLDCFDDIGDIDLFLLRLQAVTGVQLVKNKSAIVFDEVQLYPKARQALKHLVKDGRYHYIATGSLISIKKNVKDIVIPSEEKKLQMYPMDYEEFMLATGNKTYHLLEQVFDEGKGLGDAAHRKVMRDFRIYMAVGGMPQAVEAYVKGKNFTEIDEIKREIISLYEDDFKKIDPSGRIGAIYRSIPSQLSQNKKRFVLSGATGKKKTSKDDERVFDLIDSKTVIVSYNTRDPRTTLSLTRDDGSYKLYVSDTGLFVTMMFMDRPSTENEIYAKLLSDKLPANLGYLYENVVAQMLTAEGRELYYHTWEKENSTHYYEIDFLLSKGTKVDTMEVKSSGVGKHESLNAFRKKYSSAVGETIIISQKDLKKEGNLKFVPVYMTTFLSKNRINRAF